MNAALVWFGLREDETRSAEDRLWSDLFWAVFGPVLVAAFVWTVFGETIGMIAALVMVPFLVVGVREVLSGRVEARRSSSR